MIQPFTHTNMPAAVLTTDVQRAEAVALYLSTGSLAEVARRYGVDRSCVGHWRNKSWWQEIEQTAADELVQQAVIHLRRNIVYASQQLQERIQNGDTVVLAGGQTLRVPVRARDLAIVLDRMQANLRLLQNRPTSYKITGSVRDVLSLLDRQQRTVLDAPTDVPALTQHDTQTAHDSTASE